MNDFHTCRRHEIDWLRVLAFISLILYHIGMFYVSDWGWHVKSQYQSELLQNLMLLVNPWRMSLIFFISGFALSMVEPKISSIDLLRIRFIRVFIPLIIGMYLIVPPQTYYEAVVNFSYSNGYWAFWLEYIRPSTQLLPEMHVSSLGMLTWNHLWYLMYLWVYSLIYVLLSSVFKWVGHLFVRYEVSVFFIFIIPVMLLMVYGLYLKPNYPQTNALFDDWYNHAVYFSMFVFGYLAAKSEHYINVLVKYRTLFIKAALTSYFLMLILFKTSYLNFDSVVWNVIVHFFMYANIWLWILSVVGYAGRYLNKPSPTLNYLNEAILPWYILHQTVIIIVAMTLSRFSLGGGLEALLVVFITFTVCALLYELIKRWNISRFIFGMKLKR